MYRNIIEIDEERCDGCGNCVLVCEEGAIEIINDKARVVNETFCDGLGACIGDCPQDALRIVDREAETVDQRAIERHQQKQKQANTRTTESGGFQTISARMGRYSAISACQAAHLSSTNSKEPSMPVNWPIQIDLVPSTAPFLQGCELLLSADCVPVVVPNFRQDFLKGKVILMGCPKQDDAKNQVDKLAQIFRLAGIRSVTVVIMEVYCCSELPVIVKKALKQSGRKIDLEEVVVGIPQGRILGRRRWN